MVFQVLCNLVKCVSYEVVLYFALLYFACIALMPFKASNCKFHLYLGFLVLP